MQAAIADFLASSRFAVVGASADQSKFGYKVLKNYINHDKTVVPVNPKTPEIAGVPCVKSLADLDHPAEYAVSVVTPPPVTEKVMQEAAKLGIKKVWMQPGSDSKEAVKIAKDAGMSVIHGGPCVLVQLR